ncbi:diguanylate cyclase [Myxococcota bacterium]|nr:diguanylate cyclase [Myxococcota bacterium]
MKELVSHRSHASDPRRIRELLTRAKSFAEEHQVRSLLVGMWCEKGDLVFPEVVDFIESSLRVDDAIFRMTRERVILFLTDVDRETGEEIVRRNLQSFQGRFARTCEPSVQLRFSELGPDIPGTRVRDVLLTLFDREGTSG